MTGPTVSAFLVVGDGQFEVEPAGGTVQLVCGDTRIVLDSVPAANSLLVAAQRAVALLVASKNVTAS